MSVCSAFTAAVGVSALEPEPADAVPRGGYVKRCGGGDIFLRVRERRTFMLHNRARKNRGLPAFCVHPALQRAARAHSKDMIRRDYFAHGRTGKRLRRFGYNWITYGENIGRGYRDPRTMFRRWMNSRPHRANILDGRFREIGVGIAVGEFRDRARYPVYTVDFGARR